jgi:hypothetical protein
VLLAEKLQWNFFLPQQLVTMGTRFNLTAVDFGSQSLMRGWIRMGFSAPIHAAKLNQRQIRTAIERPRISLNCLTHWMVGVA